MQSTCAICEKVFKRTGDMRKHVQHVHEGRAYNRADRGPDYQCSECDFKGRKIKEHWNEQHYGTALPVSCKLCDFQTYTDIHLEVHNSKCHGTVQKCEECDFESESKVAMARHQQEEHDIAIKKTKKKRIYSKRKQRCLSCGEKTDSVIQHWNTCHAEEPMPFLCHQCDYRTVTNTYLKTHMRIMHGEQLFECEICDFSTRHKDVIAYHMNKHRTGGKDHICQFCSKGLSTVRSLRCHMYKKHGKVENEKDIPTILKDVERKPKVKTLEPKCLKCSLNVFASIQDFNEHVLLCYGSLLDDSIEFQCRYKGCPDPRWNSAEVLHYHLFSHHGVPDRVCELCGSVIKCAWNSAKNMELHKNSVHALPKEEFACETCGKTFTCKLF